MPGYSELDRQVLRGEPRTGLPRLRGLSAGYSALDDQVLNALPRARVGNLGNLGIDWEEVNTIFDKAASLTANVLKLRPPAGTTLYSGPQGTYSSAGMPGVPTAQLLPPGLFNSLGGGSILPWLLVGGVVLLLVAKR